MFRLAAKWANITSLCDEGAIHHCAIALHHFGAADTSLKSFEFEILLQPTKNIFFVAFMQKIQLLRVGFFHLRFAQTDTPLP
jgi:hypothetical protein